MKPTQAPFVIVGAGAAGLAAAITAARRKIPVTLIEHNAQPGKKILVSGNGRCNIENRHIDATRYYGSDPDLVRRTLEGYDSRRVLSFLRSIGLETQEEQEGKLFPMGRQAATVVALLTRECQRLGVTLVTDCRLERIDRRGDRFDLHTSRGDYIASRLLLASGSPAAPQLGGSILGMRLAEALGHTLVPPRPALVALESSERWPAKAAGVKIPSDLRLYADGVQIAQRRGDLLFTDYGVSGLAVLDLSREASLRLGEGASCELVIDLLPAYNRDKLTALLLQRIDPERNLPLRLWLEGILHRKLAPVVIQHARIRPSTEGQLGRKAISTLVYTIKNLRLPLSRPREFRYAEVATGGVDLREVDPRSMESKRIPGLYFAGEILDVAGDRGGFNFHWAWATGIRAGEAVELGG